MKTAKSSDQGQGVFLLVFALILFLLPQLPFVRGGLANLSSKKSAQWVLPLFSYILATILLMLACSCMRTLVLTREGIVHYLFGVRYRITLWDDICDISRVCLTAKRGTEILVTRKNTTILRPRTNGWYAGQVVGNFRTQIFPMLTGRIFTLKNRLDILDCIERYYGKLDYDMNDIQEKGI